MAFGVPPAIGRVSNVANSSPGNGGPPNVTVPADVTFSPAWQPGRRAVDQAPVQIAITVRAIPDALAVPVTALVGQPGGGYAVEAVTAERSWAACPGNAGTLRRALRPCPGEQHLAHRRAARRGGLIVTGAAVVEMIEASRVYAGAAPVIAR